MTYAKSIRILNVMIGDKKGAIKNLTRYRWWKDQKEFDRKLLQEDIDALEMAKRCIENWRGRQS